MRAADDQEPTQSFDLPPSAAPPSWPQEAAPRGEREVSDDGGGEPPEAVLYVPLAVTVGDGFKFGCGFFMALAVTVLTALVAAAAMFALASLIGVNVLRP